MSIPVDQSAQCGDLAAQRLRSPLGGSVATDAGGIAISSKAVSREEWPWKQENAPR
jgi:hypothetical protein